MRGVWLILALCLAVVPSVAADYPIAYNNEQCESNVWFVTPCGSVGPCVLQDRGGDSFQILPVRMSPSDTDTGVEIWLPGGGITFGKWYFNGICADLNMHI